MEKRRLKTQFDQGKEEALNTLIARYQDLLDGTENGIAAMTICVCMGMAEAMIHEGETPCQK